MYADLVNPIFNDASKARAHLESLRWANGRFCPHCGESKRTSPTKSKRHAEGLYYCVACEKTFTVMVGTIFERSHVPLNKWLLGFHLMSASKKGISAHQLHRMLGITYKTAWFMAHRIREAMKDDVASPLGGPDKIIEADETFYGPPDYELRDGEWHGKRGLAGKIKILTLVERDGRARSVKLDDMKGKSIRDFILANASLGSRLMTDEHATYRSVGRKFASHETVYHAGKEYARGDVTTNTVEGYFSIFKRGMVGVYQHCGEQHLKRYLTEFDFRYSNRKASDAERTQTAIKGAEGKRLTYRQPGFGKAH